MAGIGRGRVEVEVLDDERTSIPVVVKSFRQTALVYNKAFPTRRKPSMDEIGRAHV